MPGSGEPDNLDERIAAAFKNGVNSTDVETLIKAAEETSVSANEHAERARARTLAQGPAAGGQGFSRSSPFRGEPEQHRPLADLGPLILLLLLWPPCA
jgi:hypothetical protein